MKTRPVSDLRNHYPEVESQVKEEGAVYLTKNGYAAAVLIGVSEYESLTEKAPAGFQRTKDKSQRGYLKKYANPDLIPLEKEAGRLFTTKNFKKYLTEADDAG